MDQESDKKSRHRNITLPSRSLSQIWEDSKRQIRSWQQWVVSVMFMRMCGAGKEQYITCIITGHTLIVYKLFLLQCGRPGFNPWVGKISWRRKWQPTPVFLPGKSHGQRNLVGYSPWGRKESDTTERVCSLYSLFFLWRKGKCPTRQKGYPQNPHSIFTFQHWMVYCMDMSIIKWLYRLYCLRY